MNSFEQQPPKIAKWLLKKILMQYNQTPVLGDLKEEFELLIEEISLKYAKNWYRRQAIKSIPSCISHLIYWSITMLKSYLKIALRNIKKQKVYSIITMSGLILGLAVFILFALMNEFIANFDLFHEKTDRIYSVVQVLPGGVEGEKHSAITPAPLLPAILSEFPEIEDATRFFPAGRMIVKSQDKIFYETGIKFVDPNFLSIFTFKMIMGNPETALSKPYSIVLTKDAALKYFGEENPVGKSLTLDKKIDVIVTGITENVPHNSSIVYKFLVSMETAKTLYSWMDDWKVNNQAAFLLLAKGYEPLQLKEKFSTIINKYYADSPDSPKRFYLHPLPDFFLKSEGIDTQWRTGGVSFIVLWIIAVLLLVIACINFMNLSTARFVTRANEVGMRKVIGAHRMQLIRQFLGESILMALISLPAAILLYALMRPVYSTYIDSFFDISLWDNPQVLILLVVVTILTGFFAGCYPAFYLSAFKPVQVLKGKLQSGKKGGRLRKTLVVIQFTFSIILILLTIISIKQNKHNLNVNLGYDRNRVVAVEISGEARDNLEILKKELVRHKDIISVSAATALPIEWDTKRMVLQEGVGKDESLNMNFYGVDYGFTGMLGIEIVEGRSFSRDFNDTKNYILNETAVRQLQWNNPIGKQLTIGDQKGKVIGVAKDFHFKSIYLTGISPAVLCLEPEHLNYMLVKFSASDRISGVVEHIKKQWNILTPDLPFEYTTLNNFFEDVLSGDNTAELSGAIGILAIFLSCLGLAGLSVYAVERRVKEIGIRKVLGASVTGIIRMLIKDFMKLVVIANIVAIPIAYFLMNKMIQFIFVYPINIGADIFIITAIATLLIAFLTVTSQTLKAAQANPVDVLQYE